MVMFIEHGIRLSQCFNRYVRTNNKYMQLYDSSKSLYLMCFDVNNLNAWSMCQPLHYADFRWIDDVTNFNIMNVALDSPKCYILEMDLEYPHIFTTCTLIVLSDKPSGKWENKLLVSTLYNKQRYVILSKYIILSKLAAMYSSGFRVIKIIYCNSHHFRCFVIISNLIQILNAWEEWLWETNKQRCIWWNYGESSKSRRRATLDALG